MRRRARAVIAERRRSDRKKKWSKCIAKEKSERNAIEEYFRQCLQTHVSHEKFVSHRNDLECAIEEKAAIAHQHLFHDGTRNVMICDCPNGEINGCQGSILHFDFRKNAFRVRMSPKNEKKNRAQFQVVCVDPGCLEAVDCNATIADCDKEQVIFFDLEFIEQDLQIKVVSSKITLAPFQRNEKDHLNANIEQKELERHLITENVCTQSTKNVESCLDKGSCEGSACTVDNRKKVDDTLATFVIRDKQFCGKTSNAGKFVASEKTDAAKKHEQSKNSKTKHDFHLQLNLPLCLTHVNVFDPSDNLNEIGGVARKKNANIVSEHLENVKSFLSRTHVRLENPRLDELWSKDAMHLWLNW